MSYKLGDNVEVDDLYVGKVKVEIKEIHTIEDSVYKDSIGTKFYKGKLVNDKAGVYKPIEFLEYQIIKLVNLEEEERILIHIKNIYGDVVKEVNMSKEEYEERMRTGILCVLTKND